MGSSREVAPPSRRLSGGRPARRKVIHLTGMANGIINAIKNAIENGKIIAIMTTTLTIDKAGRVVLPKPVRDALQISPGDSLELESGDDHIVLRPARGKGRMYKKQGVWVYDSGKPLPADIVNRTIGRVRAERDRHNLGKFK
jgi:AbrB family looped-hinge helix DNA binding protein